MAGASVPPISPLLQPSKPKSPSSEDPLFCLRAQTSSPSPSRSGRRVKFASRVRSGRRLHSISAIPIQPVPLAGVRSGEALSSAVASAPGAAASGHPAVAAAVPGQLYAVAAPPGVSAAPPQPQSSLQAGLGEPSFLASTDPSVVCAVSSGAAPLCEAELAGCPLPSSSVQGKGVLSDAQVLSQGTKPSFSSIVRALPGPSFIRDHSIAVSAFGALPDVVAKPRISSVGGVPSIFFSPEELQAAESIFVDAIVIKFISGRPSWEACHSVINSWGMQQEFIMGPLDSRSVLLRFRDRRDMISVLARGMNYINGFPYRTFRWHRRYNVKEDAALAPVWVTFPRLPIPFFVPSMLKGIANGVGNFLCFDRATSLMTRASSARVCIEVDLSKPLPEHVWIGVHGKFQQPITYEKLPKYCNSCKSLGHVVDECKRPNSSDGIYEDLLHQDQAPALNVRPSAINLDQAHAPSTQLQASPEISNPESLQSGFVDVEHPTVQQPVSSSSADLVQAIICDRSNVQPVQTHPTDHPNVVSCPDDLMAGHVSGLMHECMTDISYQHPQISSSNMIQVDNRPCTPGVCGYAGAISHADSDRSACEVLNLNLVQARQQDIPAHNMAELQATGTFSMAELQSTSTISVDILDEFLSSDPHSDGKYAWMTNLLDHHPNNPSPDLLQKVARACTPNARRYATTNPSEVNVEIQPSSSLVDQPLVSLEVLAWDPCTSSDCRRVDDITPLKSGPTVSHQKSASHLRPSTPGPRRHDVVTTPTAADSPIYAEPSPNSSLNPVQVLQSDSIVVHQSYSSAPSFRAIDSLPVDPGLPPSSQSLELSAALERFKKKVNYQPKAWAEYPSNSFDALQTDSDDDDDYSASEAQYYPHMIDVHPHAMGYLSADGRPSSTNKKIARSEQKINKRHPNAPLNAKLRSRKSSCPSSP